MFPPVSVPLMCSAVSGYERWIVPLSCDPVCCQFRVNVPAKEPLYCPFHVPDSAPLAAVVPAATDGGALLAGAELGEVAAAGWLDGTLCVAVLLLDVEHAASVTAIAATRIRPGARESGLLVMRWSRTVGSFRSVSGGRPAEAYARQDALEGEAGPFAYRADVGLRAGEQAQQDLVTGHEQRAEEADLRAGPAGQLGRHALRQRFGGRDGQAGQQALGDLPAWPLFTCGHAATLGRAARPSRREKPYGWPGRPSAAGARRPAISVRERTPSLR